jgi:hypothetical protein
MTETDLTETRALIRDATEAHEANHHGASFWAPAALAGLNALISIAGSLNAINQNMSRKG